MCVGISADALEACGSAFMDRRGSKCIDPPI